MAAMLASAASGSRLSLAALLILSLARSTIAHDHHDDAIPEGQVISAEPLDSILWLHILVQTLAWGLIFPTGMVLGIVRSKWHVPVQIVGSAVAVLGWFLGHAHKGRQFSSNIHASFAPSLMLMLIVQGSLGIYLKLHLERGIHGVIRRFVVTLHGVMGKVMPVAAWVQFIFGGITALGFCREDHLGQCLAHFIMGSAFIGYGIILTIMLLAGQAWLKRTGKSQEFFDSLIITLWGIVNTFTEHRWGQAWSHGDFQHTSMGIIWWCAGMVGIWLSRGPGGRPRRNLVPSVVIFLTGFAMSGHAQHLMLSTMVHKVFGYTLMAAGLTRMIEIAFILRDRNYLSYDGGAGSSFQFLPVYLLYASGFLFMGATEEQLALIFASGIDHVSYVLILYSVSFLMFLFVNMLIHLYVSAYEEKAIKLPSDDGERGASTNGFSASKAKKEARAVKDAEEFELEGLMSDDNDSGAETPAKQSETIHA